MRGGRRLQAGGRRSAALDRRGRAGDSVRGVSARARLRGRSGFSLLELTFAAIALLAVLGPLVYLQVTGSLTTSSGLSEAMLGGLVAMERLRHDLDQIAFPDGPDEDTRGTRPAPFSIDLPGPDEGSRIAFWMPRARPPEGAPPRRLELVPVTYELRPVEDGTGFLLVRTLEGKERAVPGVLLRRLWFRRLRASSAPEGTGPESGAAFGPGMEAALPEDMLRVTLTAIEKAASDEALDRTDARQAREFTLAFLVSLREPTLLYRMRLPEVADRYQTLLPVGGLE